MMMRKFYIIALLLGAVGTLAAQEGYSPGAFSVSSTKQVHFATENYTNGSGQEFFRWTDLSSMIESGAILDEDEWHYLLSTRTNAYQLYALGCIQVAEDRADSGLFILPDYETWIQPDGVASLDVNHTQAGYEKNTYTAAEWALMEAAGAVFFPAAGYSTNGTTPINANTHGSYWIGTESEGNTSNAYRLQFDDTYVSELYDMPKSNYYSVRQVQTVVALNENDEPSATSTIIAARRTAGDTWADIYRTLRKTGCLNTLTLPFNVPDIEASPLRGAGVFEFVGASVVNGILQLDIRRLTSNRLTAGTPYLIQWPYTGEVITFLHFENITWDTDVTADAAGTGNVQLTGFYGKMHIDDATSGTQHLNLFLGADNKLYWPSDGETADAKMLGFRAYFNITVSGGGSAPVYRGMPTSLRIVQQMGMTTGVEETAAGSDLSRQPAEKTLRNGQMVIIRNGQTFSLSGQRL